MALRQGRYKAILLDGDALGPVCHYIHLNPVRARLVEATELEQYKDSSFAHLWYPSRRSAYEVPELALEFAGGLVDNRAGRRKYREYLDWLAQNEGEKKQMGFERMSRGWVKGTKAFKQAILDDLKDEQIQRVVEAEASEMREPRWERTLREALIVINHETGDLCSTRKGQDWKVDLARYLREVHLAQYRWIAEHLHMGAPSYVQSLVSRHRKQKPSKEWRLLKKHGKLDPFDPSQATV